MNYAVHNQVKMIKKLIIFSFLNFVLFSNIAFSLCPNEIDTSNELRSWLRTVTLNFLSNPTSSPYYTSTAPYTQEIQDLLNFYKSEKDKSLITNCEAEGSITNIQVYTLMEKTIVFQRDCTPGQTRTCGQSDVGVCKFGTQTCQSTYLWGNCVGEIQSSPEICDNLDNNCDGQVDDGLTRSTNELGACSVNTERCVTGVYVPNNEYTPVDEPVCDADLIDNDCVGGDAPNCVSLPLSANPTSVVADGATTSTITATTPDTKSDVMISFTSSRTTSDAFSSSICTTDANGICSVTVKSSTAGTPTITASASGYTDEIATITFFANTPPTTQPITFTGSKTKSSEIELQCIVNDIDVHDSPINEKLTVKVWAGQCDTNDCFNTRSWASGTGVTYHDGVLMDAPSTGSTFTKRLIINQDVGNGLAATCQATDSTGAEGTWGDAYPLLTVGCPATSPTFSSITATPDPAKAGTITITFTASDTLVSNPTVTLKNKATDTVLGTATFVSKGVNGYAYSFTILNTHANGPTKIEISGQTDVDSCSIGSSIAEFNIDTQLPTVSATHSPLNSITTDTVTITATGNDVDKDTYQSGMKQIKIFVDNILKQTCTSSPCVYSSTYSSGTRSYYATINDNVGNLVKDPLTGTKSFTVTAPLYDLDVTYISRTPMYARYNVNYNPSGYNPYLTGGQTGSDQRWPNPGETVTFTAHVKNIGEATVPIFEFQWFVDNILVSSGTHSNLAPGDTIQKTLEWSWIDGNHDVKFVVDPNHVIAESSKANNEREDKTNGPYLRLHVEQSVYDAFNSIQNMVGTFSFEDWAQAHMDAFNQKIIDAGGFETARIDEIVVEPDGSLPEWGTHAPDNWLWDGSWGFSYGPNSWCDVNCDKNEGPAHTWPSNPISYWATTIQLTLLHEWTHQLGIIDSYQLNYDWNYAANNEVITHCSEFIIGVTPQQGYEDCVYYNPDLAGMMSGAYHLGYTPFFVGALNSNLGYRRGYFGEYLYDIPVQNKIRVLDVATNPLSNAEVYFYQDTGCNSLPDEVIFSGTTDNNGEFTLPNRAVTPITTETGHTLRANPFGDINVVGCNGVFLIKIIANGQTDYQWMDISMFNLAYWSGSETTATYEISTNLVTNADPTNADPTNLALNKPTTALCQLGGQPVCQFDASHTPEKAVDGDKSSADSYWAPWNNQGSSDDWWQVDLGSNNNLYKVNVYSWITNTHDWYSKFHIDVSTDASTWTTVATETDWDTSRSGGQVVSYTFNPTQARYVRIVSDIDQNWVRLQEVEIFRVLPA